MAQEKKVDAQNMYPLIPIKNLRINTENFRHNPVTDEGQAIIELLKDSDSGSKTLFDLAESINSEGYHPQQVISVLYSDRLDGYVLLDGNRRVTAIKLAKQPELIPQTFKNIKSKFESLVLNKLRVIESLPCFIYENISDAVKYLQSIHIAGSGPKSWSRLQQLRFIERYGTENDLTYAYRICKTFLTDAEINESKNFSTVERVLKENMFKHIFEDQKTYSLEERRQILSKLISDTNKSTFNSRALNKKEDIQLYLRGELSLTVPEIPAIVEAKSAKNPIPQKHVFTTLTYAGLDENNQIDNSLILLCREIRDLAKAANFSRFPIAATCLIRNLLEVSLKYWLAKHQNRLFGNINKRKDIDPTLSQMIDEISKSIKSGISVFNNKHVDEIFTITFGSSIGNEKRWLDIIVHRPYQLSLTAKDLNINNDNGLFGIIQHILNFDASQSKMEV